ncbi:WAT1-related protein At2g40900-like [Hevea brasiliensis]|uniref:WAT1-related protein At2g40900-like n=1 Tax=Hevea brasiliensis TaxID=3981 RepID=UPI0025D32BF8|nr:WAT1-related protein At2g40900-like [Hevea brasiliensis]XP_058007354.1 WAT1-related protein At2g40900-like [Hevea brasiliensis]XP_058007355.1 WAT1-related protein At2g40900-like [Hevea brasiliensis]
MEMEGDNFQGEEGNLRVKRDKNIILILENSKPYFLCIFSNFCYSAFNIISKVTLDKGMSRYVLVAYGHAFGTLTTALLALLFERKNESKISLPVCVNIFFLGLFG